MAGESLPAYLRYRLVTTGPNGKEITNDLPHPHRSSWQLRAHQPGNPGATMLGSFRIPLHPPHSEGYAAAKKYYDQLDYYQRVEGYIGYNADDIDLGNMVFAGIVDDIIGPTWGPQGDTYELIGKTDLLLANLSRPFPGELLSNFTTDAILKAYMAVNELGAGDNFNPFTAGNYTSTASPGNTSGTWSGTTDDGFSVASCSTGSGAVLISKTGAAANDLAHCQFAEATGRLKPSSDTTDAGQCGVMLSKSSSNANDSIHGFVRARAVTGNRYVLDAWIVVFVGGVVTISLNQAGVLFDVDDPQGYIPLTVGLFVNNGGNTLNVNQATLVVNGKQVIQQLPTGTDLGTGTVYPGLTFGAPSTGSATCYLTNLVQFTRFAPNGASTAAAFKPGTITASGISLGPGQDPGPSHLEVWARLATRSAYSLRYTPQPYVVGVRTLGTLDMATSPGNDLTAKVILNREDGNLLGLGRNSNADYLVSDTAATGQATPDGAGISFFRDIGLLTKYGVLQDEVLSFTHADYNSLRRSSYSILQNKINVGTAGSKTATIRRDASTAEAYGLLDRITIDDPETNINRQSALVIGRDFTEGAVEEAVMLDQFSSTDWLTSQVVSKRLQQAIFEAAATTNRLPGSGGGSGIVITPAGFAAAGNQGAFSTANSSTWVDITNSSFTLIISRSMTIEYRVSCAARLSAAGALGYVRGNIVGYDTTAAIEIGTTSSIGGFIWYMALASGKGPLPPGTYTVKMQAATDNNTFNMTIDGLFHQIIFLN